ncbi:hypothetical protein [Cellulosilyticum sp. I15G10I2]|uniref:hypothetical protein n=1 Tax=Cellulosilyticum sp. I15G10I2 TaxID=1892843 RepID=UPI00085BB607|nr:hypothetical protein [Cellulosilyticum sp. I15G10I2]
MNVVHTKYGILKGITSAEFYKNNILKECILTEPNELITPYGKLIPQYEQEHVRRKYTSAVTFYESGNLKSICLNDQTHILTPLGPFEAEKITFYDDEKLKRIFPVNGKVTGYWTEENEYALAEEHTFKFSFGDIRSKVMSVYLYPSGKLKSITLWPKERAQIQLDSGIMPIRIGVSFYETGVLKSCEPAEPTPVMTPIGEIMAYDTSAVGIHGDINSLAFYEDGTLKALATSTDKIEIYDEELNKTCYAPGEIPSLLHYNGKDIVPLCVAFYGGKVSMNEELEYALDRHSFSIINYFKKVKPSCSDCANCNLCP